MVSRAMRSPEVVRSHQLTIPDRAITHYRERLGFEVDFTYEGLASVSRDSIAIHLKCAAKTAADRAHRKQHEHLDATSP
jgi:hypothetical protein